MSHNPSDDDQLIPTTDQTSLNNRPDPAATSVNHTVPEDQANAGHDTPDNSNDSPESLDDEITKGANREDIDPDHSVDQPDNSVNNGALDSFEDGKLKDGDSLVPKQAEDNDTPFSQPDDVADSTNTLDPTHQATDNATDLDSQELYDEGLSGTAEAGEPNVGNAVVDYNPDQDKRRNE